MKVGPEAAFVPLVIVLGKAPRLSQPPFPDPRSCVSCGPRYRCCFGVRVAPDLDNRNPFTLASDYFFSLYSQEI